MSAIFLEVHDSFRQKPQLLPVVEITNLAIATTIAAIDLVAETQYALAVAGRLAAAAIVRNPELKLLVGTSGVDALVFDLSAREGSGDAVAYTVQDVVGLHLVGSPSIA